MAWLVAVPTWRDLDAVRDMIKGRRLDYYCPMFRERVVHRGRKAWLDRPLFGRYIFIDDYLESLARICNLPCISLLTVNQHPAVVPDHEIIDLRNREVRGYIPIERRSRFRPGDRIVITSGSLLGMVGYVESPGTIVTGNGIRVKVDESTAAGLEA